MRNLLAFVFTLSLFTLQAQFELTGTVRSDDGDVLPGAIVSIEGTLMARSTDSQGFFAFYNLKAGEYILLAQSLGHLKATLPLQLDQSSRVDIQLTSVAVLMDEFTVIGQKANELVPMAQSTLKKEDLKKRNLGVDIPALLDVTPSLYFTSDAGTGIGYTYLRLRGSDQSSVNVTINGVPLNDPESHGVFWVNMPDLTSSTEEIQIQRGVGTSVNGAGAFGGSINMKTSNFTQEAYGNVGLSGGSFGSRRLSVKAGTGLIDERWSVDTRLSSIASDGFIDRSSADLRSYFLSAGMASKKSTLKLITFGGNEVTQQAWFGVPRARVEIDVQGMLAFAADNGFSEANTQFLLDGNRTYNYYRYDNEVDDYSQTHYQAHYTRELRKDMHGSLSLHYTRGLGYFEQFQDSENVYDDTEYGYYGLQNPVFGGDTLISTDFIRRRWLDNHFYGFTSSLNQTRGRWEHSLGLAANVYQGGHYGEVIWAAVLGDADIRQRYYENDALKKEVNAYLRSTYQIRNDLSGFIDVQQRVIDYGFVGLNSDAVPTDREVAYSFFNPKVGLTYLDQDGHKAFISYARAHKEPNRDDHIASTSLSGPQAQRLDDIELGYSMRRRQFAFEVVGYLMEYDNQLINTGQVNDVGEGIRTNVKDSYRRGVELIFNVLTHKNLSWNGNLTWSTNKIMDHEEQVVSFDAEFNAERITEQFGTVDIAFSPSWMGHSEWMYTFFRKADRRMDLSWATKYVGEQHLDNTGNGRRVLDAFLVNDLRVDIHLIPAWTKGLSMNLQVRNILDEVYESNGWTYRYLYEGEEVSFDALFPQAGRNFMLGLNVDL